MLNGLPGNMTTIHVISCIGHDEPINNTGIAKKMNLSKANITKISSKLLKEGLIKRFQLTDNKKEIYFRLTPSGKQVFELHEKFYQQKVDQFSRFLDLVFNSRTGSDFEIPSRADVYDRNG